MSSTQTQKELIDFLWEWASSKGTWGKLLIQNVTSKNNSLDNHEMEKVFNYYLSEIGFNFNPPLPPLKLNKPQFTPVEKEIVLTRLSKVQGVNILAEDQVMDFSPNITVVYGNNGVGKTGYSRILKSQGYSFDEKSIILPNVHSEPSPQSCRIEFLSDGNPFYLDWKGERLSSDLNGISVFNSNCVNISLSNGRELLVSPQGFYLFSLVQEALKALSSIHSSTYSKYPIELSWKENLHEGTPQSIFIANLSFNSEIKKLDDLSKYTPEAAELLEVKELELKGLNKQSLVANLKMNNIFLSELRKVLAEVRNINSNLTKTVWEELINHNEKLSELRSKTQLGIKELSVEHELELTESQQFDRFIRAADDYVKHLNKEDYPKNEDDTCIYCKQNFHDEKARELVDSYSQILNNKTESEIYKYSRLKQSIIDKVNSLDEDLKFHQAIFGLKGESEIVQPDEIITFNKSYKYYRESIIQDKIDSPIRFELNSQSIISLLTTRISSISDENKVLNEKISNLTGIESQIRQTIAELKDRKLFLQKKEEIKQSIINLHAHNILNKNSNQFRSDSLSRKTSEAREELIANDFKEKFNAELLTFRKQHLKVNLSFYSKKGGSRVNQNVASQPIGDVLSEGEQKTIALCEFLTELQMDSTNAPVVFDDPVNSLDHHIMVDVALRLVNLSRERQVIVFTHNVLFYNSFFSLQKNISHSDLNYNFYRVKRTPKNTGILQSGDPINKLSSYTKNLNVLLNNGIGDREEADVAAEGYALLRTSIELLVSNHIFQDIVGRYRNNIMMTKFPAVKGDMIEIHKAEIDNIFGRASSFIKAHSHPEEQDSPPTMNDLISDYDRFKVIEKDFK